MTHHAGAVHGVLCEPRFGLSAGWAAHQGSFASRMPLWNGRRDVCLILAGEVFDPDTLTPGGEQRLLELYDSQGAAFVRALNGWFAGLLIDFRSENVLLFNDRYGMARVYVHETDDSLYVASEAKCLLGELPHLRKLDSRGLAEWLTCGCVLEGRTLFSGISLLPPGSLWRIGPDGKVGKERYFDPREWEEQPKLEPEDYYAGLQERFRRVLPRYFGGPQRIGISLTGGVDSRLIMAWHPVSAGNPPCYSFGGPFRDCLDVTIGRQVAHACGHSHQVIRVDQQFLEQFPALAARAAYVSDGAMDVTGAVELFVNAAAREIAPVRLTGNYGGEILRSMVAFGPRAISPLPFAPELRQEFARAAETYRRQRDGNPLTFIAFKQVPWHHHSRLSVEQSQLTLRSPFLDNELVAHVYRAPSASVAGKSVSLRLIQNGNPALGGIPTDRGLRLSGASVLDSAKRRWLDLI
ncbi:MAG TPA: hypothetical protein PKH32_13395, partial [Verrucomicrobiota bacterium]|nr:hypothetical protein [Verrucomicrobiota bacterium]